jgi:uncharacterized protein YbcI
VQGESGRQPRGPFDPEPQPGEATQPTGKQVSDEIRRDILAIHRPSYGRGAESTTVHILGDTVIVLLDGLELLPNEEFLIGSGDADAVAGVRSQYQKAIEPTFRAAVERATGSRVVGFASHVSLEEPSFCAEIFRLERA